MKNTPPQTPWWQKGDLQMKMAAISSVIMGLFVWLISLILALFFEKDWLWLPISTGAMGAMIFFVIMYIAFSSSDAISNSLSGTNREVDTKSLDAQEHWENAQMARKSGEFEKALENYKEYISSDLDKAPARTAFYIAQIYHENLKQIPDAVHWYKKAINYSNQQQNAGPDTIFHRESTAALNTLSDLIELSERPVVDVLVEVKQQIENQEYDNSKSTLEKMQVIYPDNAEVDYLFGHFYRVVNNFGMAVEQFKIAMEKNEDHVLAAYYIADCLEQSERLYEAKDAYKQYLVKAADDPVEMDRVKIAKDQIANIEKELSPEIAQFVE